MVDPHRFHVVVRHLTTVYPYICLAVGAVCIPFSFYIFTRPAFRNKASSIYFRALSAVDLGLLISRPFAHIEINLVSCSLSYFMGSTLAYGSNWILVVLTLERVASIIIPQDVHQLCTPRTAVLGSVLVLTCAGAINVCIIFYIDVFQFPVGSDDNNITITIPVCYFPESFLAVFFWFGLFIFVLIPSFILVVSSIIISHSVARSRRRIKQFRGESSVQPKTNMGTSAMEYGARNASSKNTNTTGSKQRAKENSLKKTLILMNAAFLVCNLPVSLYGLTRHSAESPIGQDLLSLFSILTNTNNVLNFALYYIAGSKFRTEVKAVFRAIVGLFQHK